MYHSVTKSKDELTSFTYCSYVMASRTLDMKSVIRCACQTARIFIILIFLPVISFDHLIISNLSQKEKKKKSYAQG